MMFYFRKSEIITLMPAPIIDSPTFESSIDLDLPIFENMPFKPFFFSVESRSLVCELVDILHTNKDDIMV